VNLPVSVAEFRSVLSLWPSGVTLVSSCLGGEHRVITVSAFSSVSLEPPLVLVCVNNESSALSTILQSGAISINLLAQGQEDVASQGSSRVRVGLGTIAYTIGNNGCALVVGAAGSLECNVWKTDVVGDHTVVYGLVTHVVVGQTTPRLYHQRRYGKFDG
jgi:flavin reductase (DIM6/NTAB) family NADH-FMN oxidoreductase RutF